MVNSFRVIIFPCYYTNILVIKKSHIAIVGGGTGSYVVASGLSQTSAQISMLMTMVDDGGSNKIIRNEFGLLPTSGIRQAIVALSKNKTVLRKLFTYRYHQGGPGIKGMTFGNLFMAAMADIIGSQKKGIEETCHLLQVNGDIIPVSYDNVRLVATYENGQEVVGEHKIDEPDHDGGKRIVKMRTEPQAKISPEAKQALLTADLIVIGPGDFYTNTIANLVVSGMVDTLKQTQGQILFITNLMTKYEETPDYLLSDFFKDLAVYLPLELIDYVLINNNCNYPDAVLDLYQDEQAQPVEDDLTENDINHGVKLIRVDMLSRKVTLKKKGDQLARSMIRHDPDRLAVEIMKLV